MRLSIEITPEQHQRLKASAALKGQSIKDYVLSRTLPDESEAAALAALESFLQPRVDSARNGETAARSVDEIFEDVAKGHDGSS